MEQHPTLPIVAVSGIDDTIKVSLLPPFGDLSDRVDVRANAHSPQSILLPYTPTGEYYQKQYRPK
jgi:hypothetical protein